MKTFQFHNPNVKGMPNGSRAKHFVQATTKKEALRSYRDWMNIHGGIIGERCTLVIAEMNLEKVYNE